jgi:hypothetical protein
MKRLHLLIITTIICFSLGAQQKNDIIGRWDLQINFNDQILPSWLEVTKSGRATLVGRFVFASGSARPIAEIKYADGNYFFSIPPQWEEGNRNMDFVISITPDGIAGTMTYVDSNQYNFTGVAAPLLNNQSKPEWGEPIELINGKDLTGWYPTGKNQWMVENGILKSPKSGSNLVTEQKFKDFKLHVEFRYPEGSNSGIYLRGRYEVQIIDSKGQQPSDILFGGIYGFLTPNQMAAKGPDEWQEYDITLIGRRVTIIANGIPIIQDQIIPGITGGALDSNEGEPGPFFIQGDHGPVEIRKMVVTPSIH